MSGFLAEGAVVLGARRPRPVDRVRSRVHRQPLPEIHVSADVGRSSGTARREQREDIARVVEVECEFARAR